jgi:hypothetical protein
MGERAIVLRGDPLDHVRSKINSPELRIRAANVVLEVITSMIDLRINATTSSSSSSISGIAALSGNGISGSGSGHKNAITPAHYFAALGMALEKFDTHTPEHLGGILYLQSLVFPHCAPALLRKQFDTIATLLTTLINEKKLVNAQTMRSTITCVSYMLRACEAPMWNNELTLRLFNWLLICCVDPTGNVRKWAQQHVTDLLKHLHVHLPGGFTKPLVKAFVDFSLARIAECAPKSCETACWLCGLLQATISLLPVAAVATILESLLRLQAAAGDHSLVVQSSRAVQTFFKGDQQLTIDDSVKRVTTDLVDKLLTVLIQMAPHPDDIASVAYLRTMASGFARYTRDDSLR